MNTTSEIEEEMKKAQEEQDKPDENKIYRLTLKNDRALVKSEFQGSNQVYYADIVDLKKDNCLSPEDIEAFEKLKY